MTELKSTIDYAEYSRIPHGLPNLSMSILARCESHMHNSAWKCDKQARRRIG
jgi:hypothetical protein